MFICDQVTVKQFLDNSVPTYILSSNSVTIFLLRIQLHTFAVFGLHYFLPSDIIISTCVQIFYNNINMGKIEMINPLLLNWGLIPQDTLTF